MFKKKKREFSIPQIEINEKKRDHFVSPFFGDKVKDEIVIPRSTMKGNINDRFKDFRKDPLVKDKEELQKEFSILGSEEVKNMINKKEHVENENFIKVEKKVVVEKKEDVQIPFGLDLEIDNPLTDADLNEVLGDYEVVDEPLVEEHIQEIIEPDVPIENLIEETIEPKVVTEPEVVIETKETEKEVRDIFDLFDEPKEEKKVEPVVKIKKKPVLVNKDEYVSPSLSLLNVLDSKEEDNEEEILEQKALIDDTLLQFRVGGKVVNYTAGPTVTQYEVKLEDGVMINKLTNIANNIKMNLAAVDIRIEAPIPGKSTIGIEVPNKNRQIVNFGNLVDEDFVKNSKPLDVALGVNLSGEIIYGNIEKMPHGLIAGATGSGKSVCIDTILMSLLLKATPKDLKLILIDPKRVGLAAYSKVPHLATPIIHDAKVASECLKWAVNEMERRYDLMFSVEARDIKSYNKKIQSRLDEGFNHLPNIVVVIEEMADLMAQSSSEVEMSVSRIAQKARAAGLYLIVATQRPSVDVIKGSIKSNIPTRIALKVASNTDSMTIIDYGGAESLLGNGDMLYSIAGMPLQRLQGAYVSEDEIDAVTGYLSRYEKDYLFSTESLVDSVEKSDVMTGFDDLFLEVAEYVITTNYASINKIQRNFNIGYNRASDVFTQLTNSGIVSSPQSKTPRKVLINIEQFDARFK